MKRSKIILALVLALLMAVPACAACRHRRCTGSWFGGIRCRRAACPMSRSEEDPQAEGREVPEAARLSAYESELVRQVNSDRAKNGLGALAVSAELSRAARVRAREIVEKFSHTRPDGSAWTTVSRATRGENIAKGQQTVDKVMAAWMSSSGHRANILRASFGSIGVCALRVGNVMYWVQEFGK